MRGYGPRRAESLALPAEEHRLPVGRPDFKSGEAHACVPGRFDSCLFRQIHVPDHSLHARPAAHCCNQIGRRGELPVADDIPYAPRAACLSPQRSPT